MEMDKLAQDAAKAKAAHMSYGKWKAMQKPVAKIEKKPAKGMKACVACGKFFKPHKGNQRYCEPVCRLEFNFKKHREQKTEWQRNRRQQRKMGEEKDGK